MLKVQSCCKLSKEPWDWGTIFLLCFQYLIKPAWLCESMDSLGIERTGENELVYGELPSRSLSKTDRG